MKIGLVARCLNTEHIRGMGKYLFELLRQSTEYQDLDWCLFADDVRKKMYVPETAYIQHDVFNFRGDRYRFWEQIGLPIHVLKHQVDLLHCTENTLSYWQPKPTVVTVHDTLMWDDIKKNRQEDFYYNKLLPAALHKSAAIITISQSSKNDILSKWPSFESKLSVIYHGISEEYFTDEHAQIPLTIQQFIGINPYLVYLGGPMERKRFAWAQDVLAHSRHSSLKMVACGFAAEAKQNALVNLPLELKEKVLFADFLSDAELRALYRNATAVLYPTLYEGFGFPALEAQASGVPVLFSALGSLQELIGPLAIVLPPFDLDAWVVAITDALSMGEQRLEKARMAKLWAQQFTWSACFEKHLAVYEHISKQSFGDRN